MECLGLATESVQSPILVRIQRMSKVRLSAERRCDRPDVAEVYNDFVMMTSPSTLSELLFFYYYILFEADFIFFCRDLEQDYSDINTLSVCAVLFQT